MIHSALSWYYAFLFVVHATLFSPCVEVQAYGFVLILAYLRFLCFDLDNCCQASVSSHQIPYQHRHSQA